MPKFSYKAITETGASIKGEIDADSVERASSLVAAQGYIPTQVRPISGGGPSLKLPSFSGIFAGVKTPELILFTKQFKTLIRSGTPMLTILQVLEDQTENNTLRSVLAEIHRDIREGANLHDAFRRHPEVFPPLYCSMLKAGESAGALPEILDRLVYVIEHEHKVKSDIKSAMTYPIIVLSFLAVAFFILLIGVIPKFVNVFKNAGLELPLPTKICLGLYQVHRAVLVRPGHSRHRRRHRLFSLQPHGAGSFRARHAAAQNAVGRKALPEKRPSPGLPAFFPSCNQAGWTSWTPWTSCPAPSVTRPSRASFWASRIG